MIYDAGQLDAELKNAGLRIHGCRSGPRSGHEGEPEVLEIVDWLAPPTDAEKAVARQVLDRHDPAGRLREEQQRLLRVRDLAVRIASGSATQAERDEALSAILRSLS